MLLLVGGDLSLDFGSISNNIRIDSVLLPVGGERAAGQEARGLAVNRGGQR